MYNENPVEKQRQSRLAYCLAPLTLAMWVSGCTTASGYRQPQQSAVVTKEISKKEYFARSVDDFARQEIAFVEDSLLPENTSRTAYVKRLQAHNTIKYSNAPENVRNVRLENSLLAKIFDAHKIQRYVLQTAKKNAKWNYKGAEVLDEESEAELLKNLKELETVVKKLDSTKRASVTRTLANPELINDNEQGLVYLVELLTAKADLEFVEFNAREINNAYSLISEIKKSVKDVDDYNSAEVAWSRIKNLKVGDVYKDSDALVAVAGFDKAKSIEIAYELLLHNAEEILKQNSYSDKHNAFQNAVSYMLEIPVVLYANGKISADTTIALKKRTVRDIAKILDKHNVTNLPGASFKQIAFSAIPFVGFLDFEDWKNCFANDWFEPKSKNPGESLAEIILEGRRLNSGNGSSDKFDGSTNSAIASRIISVGTTVAASVGIGMGVSSLNHSKSNKTPAANNTPNPTPTPPPTPAPTPPPIGGGGTIGPGVGN